MSVGKGTESFPVSDFGFSSIGAIDLSSIVTGGRFVLQPLVNGVVTEGKTRWLSAFLIIEFDLPNHFLTSLIAISVRHDGRCCLAHSPILTLHVLAA